MTLTLTSQLHEAPIVLIGSCVGNKSLYQIQTYDKNMANIILDKSLLLVYYKKPSGLYKAINHQGEFMS